MFLFAGMLYLDEYRRGLIAAELATMRSEANLFAAAIGESATFADAAKGEGLIPLMAQQIVRRLVETSRLRARLFATDGSLVADSLLLGGPGGIVQIEELPPPRTEGQQLQRTARRIRPGAGAAVEPRGAAGLRREAGSDGPRLSRSDAGAVGRGRARRCAPGPTATWC